MSFRGRGGGGGFRGRGGGGGGFRGRGGGRGGFDDGPPERVIPLGHFLHPCEDDMVIKVDLNDKVPYFNAPVYTKDINKIGKIDEIFGQVKDYFVSVRPTENIKAASFKTNDQVYVDPAKMLPIERFLPGAPNRPEEPAGGAAEVAGAVEAAVGAGAVSEAAEVEEAALEAVAGAVGSEEVVEAGEGEEAADSEEGEAEAVSRGTILETSNREEVTDI